MKTKTIKGARSAHKKKESRRSEQLERVYVAPTGLDGNVVVYKHDPLAMVLTGTLGMSGVDDKGVVHLSLPDGNTDHDVVVRLHETIHVSLPPRKTKAPAGIYNAVEDCRVHAQILDCRPSGLLWEKLRTVREIEEKKAIEYASGMVGPDELFSALVTLVRAMALTGDFDFSHTMFDLPGYANVRSMIDDFIYAVMYRKWQRAEKILTKIKKSLTTPPKPKLDHTKSNLCPMKIVEEPLTRRSMSVRTRRLVNRSYGLRINPQRLVHARVCNSTARLFKHRQIVPGGSLLVDASGSMNFTPEDLKALITLAPFATVGYYFGYESRQDVYGELHVVAREGYFYDGDFVLSGGGNEVDYWALEWLLRQDEPRVYVTDTQFCGGPDNQASKAHALLRSAVEKGLVQVVLTVDKAKEVFSKYAK